MIVTAKQFNIILFIFHKKLLKMRKTRCLYTINDCNRLLRLKINMMINGLLMHKMGSKN